MNLELMPAPETKAAENVDLKDAFDDFMSAFEAFKEGNDAKIDQIERKLSADVVTEEKVARIGQALDSQKRLHRPPGPQGPPAGARSFRLGTRRSRRASTRRRSKPMSAPANPAG